MSTDRAQFYEFGRFRLQVSERRLTTGSEVIALTPKVFDTLLVLLENAGRTVPKEELLQTLWPDTFVEETSLAQNIFQLRKALSESNSDVQYIETIPKRGYRFSAPVRTLPPAIEELIIKRQSETSLLIEEEVESVDAKVVNAGLSMPRRRSNLVSLPRREAIIFIVLVLTVLAGTLLWRQFSSTENIETGQIRTLAVVPFRPLDAASGDEQLRLGMADALISRLSNLRSIIVRPTSATLVLSRKTQNPVELGRQLRVDAVLDGTIQRSGDRLRLNVQLVRVSDGAALWSEKFDESYTNVLALQDSISERVSSKLVDRLTVDTLRQTGNRYTKNAAAYGEYVKGRYFWNRRSEDGFRRGIEHFGNAIEIDPTYALAYSGMADCYLLLAIGQFGNTTPAENFERARASAKNALDLDQSLAEAQTTLAAISSEYDGNWVEAEKFYVRALELNPHYATAHHWYALDLLAAERFDQSLTEMKKALELDPLSLPISLALGQVYFYTRRYDAAINQFHQTLELDVDHARSRIFLGLSYEQKGMFNDAMAEFDKVLNVYPDHLTAAVARAHTQALLGRQDQANKTLRRLTKRPNPTPLLTAELAALNTALGNNSEALRLIRKISNVHAKHVVIRLKFDPRLDNLRPYQLLE